jgi:hypothetical protein
VATPDPGIKRVIIPQQTLSEISTSGEYFVRYRIVTEDETVTSEWSPKYKFDAKAITSIIGFDPAEISYQVVADGTYMILSWNTPTELKESSFDTFIKWDSGSFSYLETTSNNTVSVFVPTSPRPSLATFHVQLSSNPKVVSISDKIKMFETEPHTTTSIVDGGTI